LMIFFFKAVERVAFEIMICKQCSRKCKISEKDFQVVQQKVQYSR